MSEITRSKTRVSGFKNEEMDFQLLRQLGSAWSGGASAGECLSTASRIREGDPASWVEEFARLAEWQRSDADKRAALGHAVSARDQYLKASNSFRAAEYYTSCLDARHAELGVEARDCFIAAMGHVDHGFETFSVPYGGLELPVYLMTPRPGCPQNKTLIIVSGFDGTREEEFLMRGSAALERGYNVALFAGPGQMDLFRITGETFFEPDFERPVGAVLDAILPRAEVDPDRVALMGISFGGYFATRAATHDGRIKALIANSPILDLHRYLVAFLDHDPAELPEDQDFGVGDLAQIPEDIFPAEVKSRSENLMVRFGRRSFRDTFRYLRRFIVGPAISEIQCPALALVGEGEGAEPQRQFDEFVANVPSPVTSYRFSAFEGADTHCQVGNPSYSAAVALDWLDGIFEEMPGD